MTGVKLLAVLSCFLLVRGEVPTVYLVKGVFHLREILWDNLPSNFNAYKRYLPVDYTNNDIYVSLYDENPAILNINTKQVKSIEGVYRAQCITIDQNNQEVFIGAYDGIFRYNSSDGRVKKLNTHGARSSNIYNLYFKNVLYYTTHYTSEMYKIIDGQVVSDDHVKMSVLNFVIDNKDNLIYEAGGGDLYFYNKAGIDILIFEDSYVNSLNTDKNGNVYFATKDGVYELRYTKPNDFQVHMIVNVKHSTDIAFDNENNLMYYISNDHTMYRLKPADKTVCENANNNTDKHTNDKITFNNDDIKTQLETTNKKIEELIQAQSMLIDLISNNTLKGLSRDSIQADIIIVDGEPYRREILYDNLNSASNLVVDQTTNNVFFFAVTRLARYNLDTKQMRHFISKIVQCLAIDQDTHDIYLGAYKGIHRYRQGIEEAELVGAADVDVWRISYNKALYFTEYKEQHINKFVNGSLKKVLTLDSTVKLLLIDNNDIYYSEDYTTLYGQWGGHKHLLYEGYVTALATDKYGNVYACADDGIYLVVRDTASVRKVASVTCYNGLGFDKDNNIVYSDQYRIIRLKPVEEIKATTEIIANESKTHSDMYDNIIDIKNQMKSLNDKLDKMQKGDMPSQTIRLNGIKNMNITFRISDVGVEETTTRSHP